MQTTLEPLWIKILVCVFVRLYYPFGTKSSINCHIILNHNQFLSPMILPSDSESLLLASDSTPTSIIGTVTSIKVFWTFEHQYYVILIKYSKNNILVVSKAWFYYLEPSHWVHQTFIWDRWLAKMLFFAQFSSDMLPLLTQLRCFKHW
jgi:hypothetical protein